MKSTVALIVIIAALTTVAGCGDQEPPGGPNVKPAANAPAKPNTPPPATAGSSADRRPHENDSDLLLTMK